MTGRFSSNSAASGSLEFTHTNPFIFGVPRCTGSANATWNAAPLGSQTFNLSVSKAGAGNGAVTSTPVGIACGTDCSESYPVGSTVILNAVPDIGSTFTGWSGGGCSGPAPCLLTMNAPTVVTATFTLGTETGPLTETGPPLTCSLQSVAGAYTFVLGGGIVDTTTSVLGVLTLGASGEASGTLVSSRPGQSGDRVDFSGSWVLEGPGTANCWLTVLTSTGLGLTGRMVSIDTILISVVFNPNQQFAGIAWRQQ